MARKQQPVLPKQVDAASGAKLSLANARRHLKAAERLREARLYGPGIGHLVLAVEEVAKAWLLTLFAVGFEISDDMLRNILRRHDARHAVTFGDLVTISILHVADRSAKRVQLRHKVKGYPPNFRDEWAKELESDVNAMATRSPSTDPVLALFDWIGNASARKNSGFYVDFTSEGWKHPGKTSAAQFDKDYVIAALFIRKRSKQIGSILRSGFRADDRMKEWHRHTMAELQDGTPEQAIAKVFELLLSSKQAMP